MIMHALFTNLMAATLIVHAMIGCCHHHWHRADETAAIDSVAMRACHCCAHSDAAGDEGSLPSEPCNGELECQGVCSYLPTQKAQLDGSGDAPSFEQAMMTNAVVACTAVDVAMATAICERSCKSPPLPTLYHLRQLLLI